jgi:hypothetical protein
VHLVLASVLLQWAAGGLLGCWITTRRRVVGLGYGWLVRSIYAILGIGGVAAGIAAAESSTGALVRDAAGAAMVVGTVAALGISVVRRHPGVSGPRSFDPRLDLAAPVLGVVALLGAAGAAGGPYALSAARMLAGAVFLGFVTDAMLLGHWYLVQPGLSREPIKELVGLAALAWPFDVVLLLVPTGMISVLNGSIPDGYEGLLGVTWAVSALTTIALLGLTWRALEERFYSAVMAATGLLYLAILTAFGTDVLARALLAR